MPIDPISPRDARRTGPVLRWLVVAIVAAYLVLAMANHTLLGVSIPWFGAILLPAAVAAVALARRRIDRDREAADLEPIDVLIAVAIVAVVLNDLALFQSAGLRDLALYLRAGWFASHNLPVYLTEPMRYLPRDQTLLPFLYPPFTLPFFAELGRLPWTLVAPVWVLTSVAASVASLRLLGVSWRWSAAFLLWPPFAEGLYVGNVAVPALLLFAAATRAGTALPLAATFKFQAGVPSLWLLHERRFRELASGLAALAVLIVVTLPAVGAQRWPEWVRGLIAFRASESAFPALAGNALTGALPTLVYLAAAVVAVAIAWRARGRDALARFGVAAIVASPSLYSHGFLLGLPAFLALNRFWFWAAIGLTASVWGVGWWGAVGLAVAAWWIPALTHRDVPSEALHPLQGAAGPWRRPLGWGRVPVPATGDRHVPSDA